MKRTLAQMRKQETQPWGSILVYSRPLCSRRECTNIINNNKYHNTVVVPICSRMLTTNKRDFITTFPARGAHTTTSLVSRHPSVLNPFRTAVPFWGRTTSNLSGLSPKRDCGTNRVNVTPGYIRLILQTLAASRRVDLGFG